MSFAEEVRGVAIRLAELLEQTGIEYAFMGGMVVLVWGIPRATYDVDVTLSADREGITRFLAAAKQRGFQVDPPFEKGFLDRLSGMDKLRVEWWTPALGPVDLILHKLVAGRPKDLADIQNILAVQGLIDERYLRDWSARLGVSPRLGEALRQAGLG